MIRFQSLAVAALAVAMVSLCAQAQFKTSKDAVDVSIATEHAGIAPGKSSRAAVVINVHEGLHINSNAPLEKFLIATSLKLEPLDGVTVDRIIYPKGEEKTFGFSKSPLSVYEGKVAIGIALTVADTVAPGTLTLKGTLRVQACNDTQCMAPANVPVEIPIVVATDAATAPQHPDIFAMIDEASKGTDTSPTPAPATPNTTSGAPIAEKAAEAAMAPTAPATNETWRELLPRFTIAGQTGYVSTDEFIKWIDRSESGRSNETSVGAGALVSSVFTGGFTLKGLGLPAVLLLTLIGGIALNLTPCVLPLIPVNLAIIGAGTKAGSRSRGFLLGGVYGLGMALLYGALGLVAVLGAASFGTLNAQWWFNAAIAAVFIVLALAMFDVILIDFTKYQSKLGVKKDSGNLFFAFIMGSINALLAGACVAPVVIAVVLYSQDAYAKGAVAALALPFLLGVGMALPWPFAGAGMAFLPKPGMWMVRVKQAFGVFIIVFAVYYGYQAYGQFSARYLVDRGAVLASAEQKTEEGWESSLDAGLAKALRENKPVLLDFWATWCKNCQYMNETTFKDDAVLKRLEGFVKIKYQAEEPEVSPAKDVLENFEFVGLPLYVVLTPKA